MGHFEQTLELHTSRRKVLVGGANSDLQFYWKRLTDTVLATVLLLLMLPVFLAVAIAIRTDSPGAVFFVQERVGARRRGRKGTGWEIRNFQMYKFRTMFHSTDQSAHRAYIEAFVGGQVEAKEDKFKLTNDKRITRVGRLLRKTSLDEFPQLFNVIRGEMSLVGPRPVPIYEAALYRDAHLERLCALPGITGLWQVMGRCQVPFEEMIRMDLEYVRNQSAWLDFKILLATIPAVVSGRGAE